MRRGGWARDSVREEHFIYLFTPFISLSFFFSFLSLVSFHAVQKFFTGFENLPLQKKKSRWMRKEVRRNKKENPKSEGLSLDVPFYARINIKIWASKIFNRNLN